MTNEELATAVAQGQTGLQVQLWEQVRGFVRLTAYRALVISGGRGGVTIEDLLQQGYIAMMQAVGTYDPERGPFLYHLSFALRRAFAEAGGYRSTKRDPLNDCSSLDAPIIGGEDSEDTYLNTVVDPCDQYDEADRRIYTEQLHGALDAALDSLSPKRAAVLRAMYWQEKANTEIAAESGVSVQNVGAAVRRGIDDIRRSKSIRALSQFLDERTSFYSGTGYRAFEASGSAVERAVIYRDSLTRRWKNESEKAT